MRISDWSSDVCSSDLCLAALNTPLEQACAQLFAHVLRDSLGGTRDASDVLIPNVDLSQLWPDQLESYLAQGNAAASSLKRGHAVRQQIGRASCRERVCTPCRSGWARYHGKKKE